MNRGHYTANLFTAMILTYPMSNGIVVNMNVNLQLQLLNEVVE